MQFGLRWKILLLAVMTPVVMALGALWLVGESVSKQVRTKIDEDLLTSSLVCENIFGYRWKSLQASAEVIAKDPRFFAALSIPGRTDDKHFLTTVSEVSDDFGEIADADLFEVVDEKGRLLASSGADRSTSEGRRALLADAPAARPHNGILVSEDRQFQVAVRPVIVRGRNYGTLILGNRIDNKLAASMRSLTGSELTFVRNGVITGTTLPPGSDQSALLEAIAVHPSLNPREGSNAIVEVEGTAETFLTLLRSMPGRRESGADFIILQRSLDKETEFLSGLQSDLRNLGILVVLAALALGLFVSRRITEPVLHLVKGAEEMERGNYEQPIDVYTNDEIGYLANRFRVMRENERSYVENLEEVGRLKSEFIDIASHELKTPVTVIRGYSEILSRGDMGNLTDEQKGALEAIEEQLKGISLIADNAGWMAQIQSHRPILSQVEVEIGDLVQESVRAAKAAAVNRELDIQFEQSSSSIRGRVDASRLSQAIEQLVRNAIRFTPDGGTIRVRATKDENYLTIQVEDTGIGIPPDKIEALFGRSVLLRNSLNHHSSSGLEFKSAGLGLGLPVARGIVEAHGGSIDVDSEEGVGTVFTLRIPQTGNSQLDSAA